MLQVVNHRQTKEVTQMGNEASKYHWNVGYALRWAPTNLVRVVNGDANWYPAPLKGLKPSVLRAAAERIRQVADFFEAYPGMRIKGEEYDDRTGKVCAIGAISNARKLGIAWDSAEASKNCNAKQTTDLMSALGIIECNDSSMPAAQFRTFMRHSADVLDRLSEMKKPLAKNDVIQAYNADPYFTQWANKVGVTIGDQF
jgi:hypothetical protein